MGGNKKTKTIIYTANLKQTSRLPLQSTQTLLINSKTCYTYSPYNYHVGIYTPPPKLLPPWAILWQWQFVSYPWSRGPRGSRDSRVTLFPLYPHKLWCWSLVIIKIAWGHNLQENRSTLSQQFELNHPLSDAYSR